MKRNSLSNRHQRTRRDHATETAEDYVEAIAAVISERGECRVMDLARQFQVSHVTVTKIVSRLKREGLVTSERYGPLQLTDAGRRLARQSQRRHEIVYKFLIAIGVREEVAAIDTEGIEHHVSPETLEKLQAFIENRPQA